MATAQELATQSNCSVCDGLSLFEAMEITILKNILTEIGAPMTQAEINAASSCFICQGMSLAQANILVLLNALATASSGFGGLGGVVDPNGVVVGAQYQTYFNSANSTFWVNLDGALSWLQLI